MQKEFVSRLAKAGPNKPINSHCVRPFIGVAPNLSPVLV